MKVRTLKPARLFGNRFIFAGVLAGLMLLSGTGARADAPLSLALKVWALERDGTPAFYSGESIPFDLTVRNPQAELASARAFNEKKLTSIPTIRITDGQQSWTNFVTVRIYKGSDSRRAQVAPGFNWVSALGRAWIRDTGVAEVGASPLSMCFDLSPGLTGTLPPGEYTVVATYNSARLRLGTGWRGQLRSVANFKIQPADREGTARVLRSRIRVALDAKDLINAGELAEELVAMNTGASLDYELLGTVYRLRKDWTNAISAYQRCLQLTPAKSDGTRSQLQSQIDSLMYLQAKEH